MAFSTSAAILKALELTDAKLGDGLPLDVLIVGGAALILSGFSTQSRSTGDVDVLSVVPAEANYDLDLAAASAGRELGLPPDWFNRDAGLHRVGLPDGWEGRRHHVEDFTRLRVFTAGRSDLVAMKFYAHRERDVEDLESLNPTADELRFARSHFVDRQEHWLGVQSRLDLAIYLIDHWND